MKEDIVANALNQIMNAKRVGKTELEIKRISGFLLRLLELMKKEGHIDFEVIESKKPSVKIKIIQLNECRAIKPRYTVQTGAATSRYLRRFLPSRNFGVLVVSTNQGLMGHKEVEEKKIGGCLIAYFY